MRKALAICGVVAVLAIFAGSAQADWGCRYGYQPGIRSHSSYFHFSYGVRPHYHWHDTSHWDYHPTQIVPHGNHYHVVPGHYHWHQDGHWDRHW